jgi:phosphatidylinositol-3-phosphatase
MSRPHRLRRTFASLVAVTVSTLGIVSASAALAPQSAVAANGVPRPDHVVLAIFENTKASSIYGSSQAPYINSLANAGAKFTQSFAIEHPSEPNYLDLFSGSNQGVTDDSCPHTFSTDNEGAELIAAGLSFTGYSEDLPSAGSTVCTSGLYARKHNPWVNFSNVPAASNQPFSAFPTDFTQLPTVSWVVPNLCNDMHDCSISTGDTWLQTHLNTYAQWATTHNSLLIVTFDEDDGTGGNNIATLFYGQPVKQGTYTEHINHFNVLRTIEDMYGLPYAGAAATATPITDCWTTSSSPVVVTNPGGQSSPVNQAITPLQLSASGGTPPYQWTATGLPPGLSISTSGVISGTPTVTGTFTVTATATDTVGASGNTAFSWRIKRR